MKRYGTAWRGLAMLLLVGMAGACAAPPKPALFLDAAAWPAARSVALVGVSFDERYRPLPQSGLDHDLMVSLRRVLQAKGYRVLLPERRPRFEPVALTAVSAAELVRRAASPVDLVLVVHVDFLVSSATYGESNPPPEFEIAAEARVVAVDAGRDLWRDRADVVVGGAAAMGLRNPDYDRLRGVTELADQLLRTLPAAGARPQAGQGG